MRSDSGAYFDEQLNVWVVTDREMILAALTNAELSSVRYTSFESIDESFRPLARVLSQQLFYLDPPDHTRIRSAMNRAFTVRSIKALRAQIEFTCDALIDSFDTSRAVDIIDQLAYPLPVSVICDLLDVPGEMRDQVRQWSAGVAMVMGKAQPSPDEIAEGVSGMDLMLRYLGDLLLEQRKQPTSAVFKDFLTSSGVTDEEILANAAALLLVGHETTTNLIGNGMLALLQHPQQLQLLRENSDLMGPAVEELLRYDSSVQNLLRRATTDTAIGDTTISAGSAVVLVIGAGNRDCKAFVDPHELDIQRDGPRHIAFGHGMHMCIGAALARLEAEVVIPRLLSQFDEITLADQDFRWHPSLTFRGLEELRVQLSTHDGI